LYPHPEKLFVELKSGEEWQRLPTQVFPKQKEVRAQVDRLGDFRLQVDEQFAGSNLVPTTFRLQQNYPNPFNPSTVIAYDLPAASQVVLTVYNSLGQRIKTLFKGQQQAGTHQVKWDATDDSGRKVPSGIYFYHIKAASFSQTRKMIYLR
ncbi:MAG: T9SS C-terminal target domain-containing protein, partial [Calditrichaeota bacterium]